MASYYLAIYGTDLMAAVGRPSSLVIHIIVYPSQPPGMVTAPEVPPGLMCVGFDCPFDTTFRPPSQTFDLVAQKAPRCWMSTITILSVHNGQEPVFTATVYIKSAGALVRITSQRVRVTVGPYFVQGQDRFPCDCEENRQAESEDESTGDGEDSSIKRDNGVLVRKKDTV